METTTEDAEYDDYKSYPEYQAGVVIWKVVPPILIIFGTIGNILSIIVLTRKSIRVSTTALYLTFLAFSDLCVLYTGLLRQWLIYLFQEDVRHVSQAACKIHIWFVYTFLDFSAWILIAVTLERVISAWCPYSAKTKCSQTYATALVIAIFIFLLGLNSHLLYGMGFIVTIDENNATNIEKCVEVDESYSDFFNFIWPWIDLCAFCLIPFSVIVVGNCCILFRVIKSRRKTNARVVPSINISQTRTYNNNSSKHSSMTAMLFTLNMVFLFTTSPVSIYNIGYSHWLSDASSQTTATLDLWWAIVNMLMYTNNSLNFLLYCLSGTRFRMEVKRIFCSKFGQRSETPLDIYTRTKFNTQVPTQTPSATPNMDRKLPNILPIPDPHLHRSDTSGFGSTNSLHPNSALNLCTRTDTMTNAAIVNGVPCPSAEDSSPDSGKHSLNSLLKNGSHPHLDVIASAADDEMAECILPNHPECLANNLEKSVGIPNNEKHPNSYGRTKSDNSVENKNDDNDIKVKTPTSNHSYSYQCREMLENDKTYGVKNEKMNTKELEKATNISNQYAGKVKVDDPLGQVINENDSNGIQIISNHSNHCALKLPSDEPTGLKYDEKDGKVKFLASDNSTLSVKKTQSETEKWLENKENCTKKDELKSNHLDSWDERLPRKEQNDLENDKNDACKKGLKLNVQNDQTLEIPTISATLDDGIRIIEEECSV